MSSIDDLKARVQEPTATEWLVRMIEAVRALLERRRRVKEETQ